MQYFDSIPLTDIPVTDWLIATIDEDEDGYTHLIIVENDDGNAHTH